MILQNQIKCNNCGDVIYSAHQHDFKTCSCGQCAVDGGLWYLRRVYSEDASFEDQSISIDAGVVEECRMEIEEAQDTGRNSLGILCAVMRTLDRHGLLSKEKED